LNAQNVRSSRASAHRLRGEARWLAAFAVLFAVSAAGCSGCSSNRDRKVVATAAKLPPPPKIPKPPLLPTASPDGVYETGGLRYIVKLTGGARMADKLPMVVDIHGGGGSAEVRKRDEVPDKARFVIPFGYYPAPRGGFEWYPKGVSGAWTHAELARDLPPVLSKLAKSLAAVAAAWPTDGKTIVTGHSQGGILSYALALYHPDLIGWACPLAGQLPPQMLRAAHPVAPFPEVHGFHGDNDHAVSIGDANNTIQALRRFGYTADLKPFHGGHNDADLIAPEMSGCLSRAIRHAHRT
jgi:phospholipase/carboxylesterase